MTAVLPVIRPRRRRRDPLPVLIAVLAPFAVAAGWGTGYALEAAQRPAAPVVGAQAAPAPDDAPVPPLVAESATVPARDEVPVIREARRGPTAAPAPSSASAAPTVAAPGPAPTAQPAPAPAPDAAPAEDDPVKEEPGDDAPPPCSASSEGPCGSGDSGQETTPECLVDPSCPDAEVDPVDHGDPAPDSTGGA